MSKSTKDVSYDVKLQSKSYGSSMLSQAIMVSKYPKGPKYYCWG